jgi:large subunit ribosomal protein L25
MAKTGNITLEVEPRKESGKNACRRLRARGLLPGNVYGLDSPPFKVAVSPRRIEELLRSGSGMNTIFTLKMAGEERRRETMIKELQRDPLTENALHVDFVRIDADKAIQVSIPIRLTGIATGVKNEGGVMDFVHRDVLVECLPGAIPEFFEVDISGLHVNQHVSFKDLVIGEEVRLLVDPEQIIAGCVPPRVEEAPAEAEMEEAAEAAAVEGEGEDEKKDTDVEAEEKPSDQKG